MKEHQPPYELEERTYEFALRVRLFLRDRQWLPIGWTDVKQLLRSSGSVAANYVESQEAISDGDFVYRVRICRKETRESMLWRRLLDDTHEFDEPGSEEHVGLQKEADELVRIFTSIILKKERQS